MRRGCGRNTAARSVNATQWHASAACAALLRARRRYCGRYAHDVCPSGTSGAPGRSANGSAKPALAPGAVAARRHAPRATADCAADAPWAAGRPSMPAAGARVRLVADRRTLARCVPRRARASTHERADRVQQPLLQPRRCSKLPAAPQLRRSVAFCPAGAAHCRRPGALRHARRFGRVSRRQRCGARCWPRCAAHAGRRG